MSARASIFSDGVDFLSDLRYGTPAMSEALFYDRAVLKVIRAVLVSRGVRGEENLEDNIHDVVIKCIKRVRKTGRPPKEVPEAIAIARPIAEMHGIDGARTRGRRGQADVGPTEKADEHTRELDPKLDPVDEKRMFEEIRSVLPDEQIELMIDLGAGVKQAELAAESGVAPATMRKRTETSRGKAHGALSRRGYWGIGGLAALLAGMSVLYFGGFPRVGDSTQGRPSDDDPRELASEQRSQAAAACREDKWDDCEKALDRAARLEPDGEQRAEAKQLRAAIAAGRRATGSADAGAGEKGAPAEGR